MWIHSYSKVFKGIKKENLWKIWSDIDHWHQWNPGIEFCKLEGPFATGSWFILKPEKSPKVRIQLIEVVKEEKFMDCTSFPGAKMYGLHEMHQEKEGVRLTVTMKITGPLGFLWRKLVGEKIAHKTPDQSEAIVALAKKMI